MRSPKILLVQMFHGCKYVNDYVNAGVNDYERLSQAWVAPISKGEHPAEGLRDCLPQTHFIGGPLKGSLA